VNGSGWGVKVKSEKRKVKVVNQAYPKICVNGIISHDVVYQYDQPACVYPGDGSPAIKSDGTLC